MLKFYYSGAPNPTKVALFLEETGTPYEPIPIDTRKGEQHKPEFLAVNPNAKLPAIVDGDVIFFDSSAILLYLGEKTGKFRLGTDVLVTDASGNSGISGADYAIAFADEIDNPAHHQARFTIGY